MLVNGYKTIQEEYLEEYDVTGYNLEHVKSGAKVVYIKSDDIESYGAIIFKTPPKDDKGTSHILEHCVFGGSRKYSVKDVHQELKKSSLYTRLGASTHIDTTRYEFSSMHKKDFHNILDVYMDTVLHPNIYQNENIFKQEAWRYDIDSNEKPFYNGIVYNEVKDDFINPSFLIYKKSLNLCFSDTCYKYFSGGKPENIVECTHNNILEFHKKYYHPSNMYIYLSGKESILEELRFIDEEYLKHFNKKYIKNEIKLQGNVNLQGIQEFYYPTNDDAKNKNYYSLSYLIKEGDYKVNCEVNYINALLYNFGGSPLREALKEKNLLYNSSTELVEYRQSLNMFRLYNVDVKDGERFFDLVKETLIKVSEEGIKQKTRDIILSRKEYNKKQRKNNIDGTYYYNRIIDEWLYNDSPFEYIKSENYIDENIRKELDHGFIENSIKKYFLNNDNNVHVIYKPRKADINKLFQINRKLFDYGINNIKTDIQKYNEYQLELNNTKKSNIPTLSIADVDLDIERIELIKEEYQGVTILFHPEKTRDIAYLNLYFDIMKLDVNKTSAYIVFMEILCILGTSKYLEKELDNLLNIRFGYLGKDICNFITYGQWDELNYKAHFAMDGFIHKLDDMFDLLLECIKNLKLDDKEHIRHIVNVMYINKSKQMNDNPYSIAVKRVNQYFLDYYKYWDKVTGFDYYDYITELNNNFDDKYEKLIKDINNIQEVIFNRDKLVIGVTCERDKYPEVKKSLENFIQKLPNEKYERITPQFEEITKNEGVIIRSNNVAVAKGCNYMVLGYKYNAKMDVLKSIINNEYLWKEVREKGGAYHVEMNLTDTGIISFISEKGINLIENLNAFDDIPNFLRNLNMTEEKLGGYIIENFKKFKRSPEQKGSQALNRYLINLRYEDIVEEKKEIVATTIDDIRNYADMIENVLKNSTICVAGSEEIIMKNRELFESIRRV
ncbi:MAG: hypothetical protein A2Y24_00910 [Clostridiales bacterium GWE2_32_10]|nr:MAG: hypothetical protein A2Y24_00910 [Clostridiales bacterium GWE2_32_10]HBY21335.1 hypothetical protein [Clostridiales bacterium]